MGGESTEQDIQAFRKQVALMSSGDYDAALELDDPDIEIVTRDPDVAIVGTWRGREGHRRLLAEWDSAWGGPPEYEVEEIIEAGKRFVAIARYRAVGAGSGVPVEGTFVWLCEYRDGRLARWETFTDREQALAAARSS